MSNDEEFWMRNDRANGKAGRVALEAALAHQVEFSSCVHNDIPKTFGNKWAAFFERTRQRLAEEYGDKLDSLFSLAFRSYVYACHHAATYMTEMFEDYGGAQYPILERLMTADGYADNEGWASTLWNEVANISKPVGLLQGTAFDKFPPDDAILEAMAIIWFFDAASKSPSEGESLDVLYEAIDAAYLAHGIWMWNESEKMYDSESPQAAINPAVVLARKRHAENYALIEQAINYWRENIDPNLSASKAANELVRIVPLSHKKLAEVIAAEKKKRS